MLASILIRIALADAFGGVCSMIALDEPTTNLDRDKVDKFGISEIPGKFEKKSILGGTTGRNAQQTCAYKVEEVQAIPG